MVVDNIDNNKNSFRATSDKSSSKASSKNSEDAEKARLNDNKVQSFNDQLKSLLQVPTTDDSSLYPFISYEDMDSKGNTRKVMSADPEADVALPGSRLVRYGENDGSEAGTENDNPTFLLDALVYIQGVEISDFIKGSIRVSLSGTQGFNEVSFTLDNNNDQFTWTERNLIAYHGTSAAKANAAYVQELKRAYGSNDQSSKLTDAQFLERMAATAFNPSEKAKKAIFDYKTGIGPDGKPRNPPIKNPKNTLSFARFDLAPNRPIINRMDPIRIWTLYPYRVPGKEWVDGDREELWCPEFTGYVQTVSTDDDEINGVSRITVSCTCVRQAVLRRMRISSDFTSGLANPLDDLGFSLSPGAQRGVDSPQTAGAQAVSKQIKDNTAGFYDIDNTQFYDDIISTNFGHPFPDKRIEEAVRDLLVESPTITTTKNGRGVRGVKFGGNFFYDALNFSREDARAFLQDWHKFCLFGPKRRPWTRREVEAVGAETTTDGKYAPTKVRLWFLLPASGSGPSNLADLSQVSVTLSHDVNWTNRQEILTNMVESVDYNLMVTPCGDIVCEFTQADFRPEDYGEFKNVFRLESGLVASQFASEQENPPAGLIVSTGFAVGASAPDAIVKTNLTDIFVYSPYIAARYGIEIARDSIPFLQASQRDVAAQRAVMLYQRILARSHAWSMQFTYRPFILPNRPLHHVRRSRMGITVSVEKTIELGKSPKGEIQCGLEHPRLFTGHYRSEEDLTNLNSLQMKDLSAMGIDPSDLKRLTGIDPVSSIDPVELQVFTTVAAGESTPISNRVGWSTDSILAPASGIYVLDLLKFRNARYDIPTSAAADEVATNDVGDTIPAGGDQEDTSTFYRFHSNPLSNIHFISGFNQLRKIDIQRGHGAHSGVDLRARPAGANKILAVEDGHITAASGQNGTPGALKDPRSGHTMVLVTDSGFYIWYMHLDPSTLAFINPDTGAPFKKGDRVKAGDEIGIAGASGSATRNGKQNPHLHIECVPGRKAKSAGLVRDDGRPVQHKGNSIKVDIWPYIPASGGRPHPSTISKA